MVDFDTLIIKRRFWRAMAPSNTISMLQKMVSVLLMPLMLCCRRSCQAWRIVKCFFRKLPTLSHKWLSEDRNRRKNNPRLGGSGVVAAISFSAVQNCHKDINSHAIAWHCKENSALERPRVISRSDADRRRASVFCMIAVTISVKE